MSGSGLRKSVNNPRCTRPGLAAAVCLAAMGCSAVREIPPSQYAAMPEREHVRVETRTGTAYQFERARISGDSLQGFRRLDVEGRFEHYETVPLALDEVGKMSTRRTDWTRTGILLGLGAVVVLVLVVTSGGTDEPDLGPTPRPGP